jgi:uncharacterized glyoxalase superfamily protein PhnB
MSSYKPDSYNAVSPYLVVDGADGTLRFLAEVFGATELRRMTHDSGRVIHAEIRLDDTVLMVADSVPPDWSSVPSHVHVYVPDVDATYRRAVDAGGVSVQEPIQKGDEDKRGGVKDAGGTTWWISTRVG